jgi:hypothetical protein
LLYKNQGNSVTEETKQIPVYKKVEVVVVGGGPAGFGAAVAAAKDGANTLLVERNSFFGGTGTAGFINQFRQMYHLCGIPQEVVRRLGESGCCGRESYLGYHHGMAFDLEELKFVYMDMVEESGAKSLMNTWVVDALVEKQEVKGIIIENKSGRQAILADVVIDASGDADIAVKAGSPFFLQENDLRLPSTMGFRIGGINYPKIDEYAKQHPEDFTNAVSFSRGNFDGDKNNSMSGWYSIMKKANESGELPAFVNRFSFTLEGITPWALERGTGYIYGIQSLHRNSCNTEEMSDAELETKNKARAFLKFLKKVPGFEYSYLIDFAKNIAVMESRLIIGENVLTEEDVFENRVHDDDIALITLVQSKGGWLNRHPPDGSESTEAHRRESRNLPVYLCRFGIPYGCLLPKKVDRILVPGRNFSSTYNAMFAGRAMFECMATGEAAGVAASLAVKQKMSPKKLDINALKSKLESQGVVLRKEAIDVKRILKMYTDRGFILNHNSFN